MHPLLQGKQHHRVLVSRCSRSTATEKGGGVRFIQATSYFQALKRFFPAHGPSVGMSDDDLIASNKVRRGQKVKEETAAAAGGGWGGGASVAPPSVR